MLFATASDQVIALALKQFQTIFPELPLVMVSEFPPPEGNPPKEWIRYYIRRSWSENRDLIRFRLRGRRVRLAAIILEPRTPHRLMRLLGVSLAPLRIIAFNEAGQHFRLHPNNLLVMLRHLWWRTLNLIYSQLHMGRWLAHVWFRNPHQRRLLILRTIARARPWLPFGRRSGNDTPAPWPARALPPGISVVIPSRSGRELLAACLQRLQDADEILVIDNGSVDDTVAYLRQTHPSVIVEHSTEPLSFAAAVNRGVARARFSHVCLLNNDMLVEAGFLAALRRTFDGIPELFSATAQIFLPEGRRREETGKTVFAPWLAAMDFPVRCEEPLPGEDGTWVLYGSGGCTLYDTAKLRALGGFDPVYETAYVEDLDVGVRAWQHGWPSVYCAGARVLHQHRATTSRYFTEAQLGQLLERNFVRFLARVLPGQRDLWRENLRRLRWLQDPGAMQLAATLPFQRGRARDDFLALVSGGIAVFPGKAPSGKPRVLVASPYLPFPLSHGAAVRMYNLMRRAAADVDQILISFVEELAAVPPELQEICVEIVTVRRPGSHALPSTARPDTVEEFDSPAFHAALRQITDKWRPRIAQFEFTQMAQYAGECKPARTILVEHDITYDLYAQMLALQEDWENRRQYARWLRFETAAWSSVDRVVTMSEKDRALVPGSVAIPNGVDLERFRPASRPPDPRRLLFIGSFAHRPNVLAVEYFLRDVFPLLSGVTLHVIAGQRHQRFWDLRHPGVEVEGFVSDVRPAYERASLVIAPLVASAGTNIKIMEAMAMGKAIVSTGAGIHGLDLGLESGVIVADAPEEMAHAIARLLDGAEERTTLERQARRTAELRYGWDAIAEVQRGLYASLD